jgi:hypothetical protein
VWGTEEMMKIRSFWLRAGICAHCSFWRETLSVFNVHADGFIKFSDLISSFFHFSSFQILEDKVWESQFILGTPDG